MGELAERLFAHNMVEVFIGETFRQNGHPQDEASTAVEEDPGKSSVPARAEQDPEQAHHEAQQDDLSNTETSSAEALPPRGGRRIAIDSEVPKTLPAKKSKKSTMPPKVEVGPTNDPGSYRYINGEGPSESSRRA